MLTASKDEEAVALAESADGLIPAEPAYFARGPGHQLLKRDLMQIRVNRAGIRHLLQSQSHKYHGPRLSQQAFLETPE